MKVNVFFFFLSEEEANMSVNRVFVPHCGVALCAQSPAELCGSSADVASFTDTRWNPAFYRFLAVLQSTGRNDFSHVLQRQELSLISSSFFNYPPAELESSLLPLLLSALLPAPSHLSEASVSPCPSWPHVCRVSQSIWVQASSQRGGARAGHGLIWPVARPGVRARAQGWRRGHGSCILQIRAKRRLQTQDGLLIVPRYRGHDCLNRGSGSVIAACVCALWVGQDDVRNKSPFFLPLWVIAA